MAVWMEYLSGRKLVGRTGSFEVLQKELMMGLPVAEWMVA